MAYKFQRGWDDGLPSYTPIQWNAVKRFMSSERYTTHALHAGLSTRVAFPLAHA